MKDDAVCATLLAPIYIISKKALDAFLTELEAYLDYKDYLKYCQRRSDHGKIAVESFRYPRAMESCLDDMNVSFSMSKMSSRSTCQISEMFASPTFLSRLYEDLESNPTMREPRSSEVFWRPHQVPGDPSSRSPRGAPPADRGPPAPEDPMNRGNLGETLSRESTSRRLLETNFDETPQHTRSASYSSIGLQVINQ